MRYISSIAAAAAVISVATADNAPVVSNNPIGITYSATLPNTGVDAVTGAVIGAAAPDGEGTNFQVAFYNLPGTGSLSYAIHTDRVSNGDCSTAGGVLDPYAGTTGGECMNNNAACQVGDLSDKHGQAKILSGGSGTGYFSDNYVDKYISMVPGAEAFFGKGSIVIMDSTGASVACANFINASKVPANATAQASSSMASMTTTAKGGPTGKSASSSTSAGFAMGTSAPVVGAGLLGLAALLL